MLGWDFWLLEFGFVRLLLGQTLWGCHERPGQDLSILHLLGTIVAFVLYWRELLLLLVIPGNALLFLLLRLIIIRL